MRGNKVFSLVSIGLILCAAPLRAAQDAFSSEVLKGSQDVSEGRYSSAKAEFEAAVALQPKNAEPWYQLGLLYGQMADFRSAEQSFRRALELDPRSAKAHCRLGQTLVADPQGKQDWQGAVAEFRAALQLDPNYAEADSLLGLGLMHLGETDAAVATLRHAIQLHPTEASAHLNLALVLEEQPDHAEEAVREYRAALAAKPDAPETEAALGKLLLRLGRIPEAEQAFRAALRLDPDLTDAHYGLARVLKIQNKTAKAAIEFDQAAALQQRVPDNTQAIEMNNQGLQLAAKGDLPGSLVLLRKAILLRPDYGIAQYNLGLVMADSGDFAGARDALIKAVSLLPEQAKAWFDLGRVLLKLGNTRGALQTISWAAQLSPANARFAVEAATLRAASDSVDPRADKNTVSVTEVRRPRFGALSDTAVGRLAFAAELRARGDSLGAAGELLRALVLRPDSLDARIGLAQCYASMSLWNRAIHEYRKVLLVAGEGDAGGQVALGEALLAAGQAGEAADRFRLVLTLQPGSTVARTELEQALSASNRR